jgi:B-block binding subunit of TFIIIC
LPPSQDAKLLGRVWKWLTAQSDVLVGPNGENQSLSLSDVESLAISGQGSVVPASRLFSTDDRMWLAVTGHQKDQSVVPPMHFQILCIVAAAGENGISQPELIQKSGQDKRSVPKRTDYLAEHGYIEKKPIYVKSSKTSLLIHRKFLKVDGNLLPSDSTELSPTSVFKGQNFDFNKFVAYLSDRLRNSQVMAEGDLMSELGLTSSMKWHREVVRKAIDKLVIADVLECFNAPSQIRKANGQFRRLHCIKLLRVPNSDKVKAAFRVSYTEIEAYRIKRQEALRNKDNANTAGFNTSMNEDLEGDMEEHDRFNSQNLDTDGVEGLQSNFTNEDALGTLPGATSVGLCTYLDASSSLHYNTLYQIIEQGGHTGLSTSVCAVSFIT